MYIFPPQSDYSQQLQQPQQQQMHQQQQQQPQQQRQQQQMYQPQQQQVGRGAEYHWQPQYPAVAVPMNNHIER